MAIRPAPTKNRIAVSGTGEGQLTDTVAESLKLRSVCSNVAVAELPVAPTGPAAENSLFCGFYKIGTPGPAPAIGILVDKRRKMVAYRTAHPNFMPTPL